MSAGSMGGKPVASSYVVSSELLRPPLQSSVNLWVKCSDTQRLSDAIVTVRGRDWEYLFRLLSNALTGISQPVVCIPDTPLVLLTAEPQPGLRAVSKHTVNGQTAAAVPSDPLEMRLPVRRTGCTVLCWPAWLHHLSTGNTLVVYCSEVNRIE